MTLFGTSWNVWKLFIFMAGNDYWASKLSLKGRSPVVRVTETINCRCWRRVMQVQFGDGAEEGKAAAKRRQFRGQRCGTCTEEALLSTHRRQAADGGNPEGSMTARGPRSASLPAPWPRLRDVSMKNAEWTQVCLPFVSGAGSREERECPAEDCVGWEREPQSQHVSRAKVVGIYSAVNSSFRLLYLFCFVYQQVTHWRRSGMFS